MSIEYAQQNKGPRILAVFWSLTALTLVVVIIRLFIRIRILRNTGLDDWLILASVVCQNFVQILTLAVSKLSTTAFTAVTTVNVSLGYGQHADMISPHNIDHILLLNNVDFMFGIMSFCLPKLAIVALLDRLFQMKKSHRVMLWGLTVTVFVVSCITVVIIWTMCDPPEAQWKPELQKQGAKCRNPWILVNYSIFNGSLSAFSDVVLGLYPALVVLKLKMSLRKRLALCAALGMAALVEANVNILASCIPTLQPILEMMFGKRAFRSSADRYKDSAQKTNWSTGKRTVGYHRRDKSQFTAVGSQDSILGGADEAENHALGQIRRPENIATTGYSNPRW
ncbi:hypothetical protein N7510_000096 [Penicillium lagena]|uniref:uncharacterized protein n=1 Tax=Penicillium lagena TaxID=94218 RepID=UPI002541D752|nr:uncharacterized protein N7510_000096 [Penicillium lagena]KAJ5623787.1 hypothetical protein N7510_000096 [Penicillium lagena]